MTTSGAVPVAIVDTNELAVVTLPVAFNVPAVLTLEPKNTLPEDTNNAYELVAVTFVLATGAPAI